MTQPLIELWRESRDAD